MSKLHLFGGGRRPGEVTLVDADSHRASERRARLAFWVVGPVVTVLAGAVLAHRFNPVGGLLLGAVVGAACGLVAAGAALAWPVLRVLWHWSAEILLGLLLVVGWVWLMSATGVWLSVALLAVLVGVPAVVPRLRRRLVALVWCAVVRHRLRHAFAEVIRSTNRRHVAAPLILAARPTPAGERVWVWLRTGLELRDLEDKTGKLAVACWADQIRVSRCGSSYAALVRVDIARRDPLRAKVVSPLAAMVPNRDEQPPDAPVSPGMPPLGLDLSDVPETDQEQQTRQDRRPRRPRTAPVADVNDAYI